MKLTPWAMVEIDGRRIYCGPIESSVRRRLYYMWDNATRETGGLRVQWVAEQDALPDVANNWPIAMRSEALPYHPAPARTVVAVNQRISDLMSLIDDAHPHLIVRLEGLVDALINGRPPHIVDAEVSRIEHEAMPEGKA